MSTNNQQKPSTPVVGVDEHGFIEQRGGEPKHISVVLQQIRVTLMNQVTPTDINTKPRQN